MTQSHVHDAAQRKTEVRSGDRPARAEAAGDTAELAAVPEPLALAGLAMSPLRRYSNGDDPLGGSEPAAEVSETLRRRRGQGQPLPENLASGMGQAMGSDLSSVRLHTDGEAAQTAEAVQAEAFTVGNDIYFGEGRYSPGTNSGQRLIAHEAAHVVQQRQGSPLGGAGLIVGPANDPAEAAADQVADNVLTALQRRAKARRPRELAAPDEALGVFSLRRSLADPTVIRRHGVHPHKAGEKLPPGHDEADGVAEDSSPEADVELTPQQLKKQQKKARQKQKKLEASGVAGPGVQGAVAVGGKAPVGVPVPKPLTAKQKRALKAKRRESLATLEAADKVELCQEWNLKPEDAKFQRALGSEESYQFFKALTHERRKLVSATQIKKALPIPEDKWEGIAAERAKIEAQEKAKQEAAEKIRQAKEKFEVDKKYLDDNAKLLRERIAQRVIAEIPGFDWEAIFDEEIKVAGAKVAGGARPARLVTGASEKWDAQVDLEKKRREVTAALTEPGIQLLRQPKLGQIKASVMGDATLTGQDFRNEVAAALVVQRNPKDKETWASWMKFSIFPSMEELPSQLDYAVHFSVDYDGIVVPALVTAATTAEQLVDRLLSSPKNGKKMYEAHVSLDTGVFEGDKAKNPHKYWRDGANDFELRYGGGGYLRWNEDWSEDDIKDALDASIQTIRTRLIARAQKIIDAAGPPRS
ncbi:MAG: hypothetical protein JWN95_2115 [Frankiales bacterium]|nr:hypothetical protein [Frankiales bacterium]